MRQLVEFLDLFVIRWIRDPLIAFQVSPQQGVTERRSGGVGPDEFVHQFFEFRVALTDRPPQVLLVCNDDVGLGSDVVKNASPQFGALRDGDGCRAVCLRSPFPSSPRPAMKVNCVLRRDFILLYFCRVAS